MTLDELHSILVDHVGERVRVTIRNGVGRECVCPAGVIGMWHEYPTIGGHLVGGELDNATRVEIMQSNGRYTTIRALETIA